MFQIFSTADLDSLSLMRGGNAPTHGRGLQAGAAPRGAEAPRTDRTHPVWGLGFAGWVLGFGFWVLGFGFWVLGFGFWGLGFKF